MIQAIMMEIQKCSGERLASGSILIDSLGPLGIGDWSNLSKNFFGIGLGFSGSGYREI